MTRGINTEMKFDTFWTPVLDLNCFAPEEKLPLPYLYRIGATNRTGRGGEDKIPLLQPGIEPRSVHNQFYYWLCCSWFWKVFRPLKKTLISIIFKNRLLTAKKTRRLHENGRRHAYILILDPPLCPHTLPMLTQSTVRSSMSSPWHCASFLLAPGVVTASRERQKAVYEADGHWLRGGHGL